MKVPNLTRECNFAVASCGLFRRKPKKNVHVFRARDAPSKFACAALPPSAFVCEPPSPPRLPACFQDVDVWIYEEVRRIAPRRPPVLLLIGAKGVGRRSVKRLLCRQWPKEFALPVVCK